MSGGVPAGWVLVPVEVTNGVLQAGYEAMFVGPWDGSMAPMMHAGYVAMLAATPTPPIEGRDADVERARKAAITAMGWTNPRMVDNGKRYLAGQHFASFGFGGECSLTAPQVEALRRCYDGARAALQALGERG